MTAACAAVHLRMQSRLALAHHENLEWTHVNAVGGQRFAYARSSASFLPVPQIARLQQSLLDFRIQEEAQANFRLFATGVAEPRRTTIRLEGAWVSLLSPASSNWMHWLSECLPSALPMPDSTKYAGGETGLLVDKNLPGQAMESLKLLSDGRRVHLVEWGKTVHVERLVPGSLAWSVFWPRGTEANPGQYRLDPYRLLALRERLLGLMPGMKTDAPLMLIERDPRLRIADEFATLRRHLAGKGFAISSPQASAFTCQVEQFHSAQVVVGQAGAAFANMMFMKPGTCAIIYYADNRFATPSYWIDYGNVFGVNVQMIPGSPVPPHVRSPSEWEIPFSSTHLLNSGVKVPLREIFNALARL